MAVRTFRKRLSHSSQVTKRLVTKIVKPKYCCVISSHQSHCFQKQRRSGEGVPRQHVKHGALELLFFVPALVFPIPIPPTFPHKSTQCHCFCGYGFNPSCFLTHVRLFAYALRLTRTLLRSFIPGAADSIFPSITSQPGTRLWVRN